MDSARYKITTGQNAKKDWIFVKDNSENLIIAEAKDRVARFEIPCKK
ncbi:unnamed protein product [marine sediment metagenome]|uniref:Uncharacterized protein n=1 Tax=marine sediment metagenome TaxID=412755 RepID=X1E493_9ZZZZ